MKKKRFLFASVDAPPRIGGVSLLAESLSNELAEAYANEAIFVGPKGTCFERGRTRFKLYEDFQSDTQLRAGPRAPLEDARIEALFTKLIKAYDLDHLVLWHPFYYGPGGLAAAAALGVPVTVFIHGTELTSQIKTAYNPDHKFEYLPGGTDLPSRLYETMQRADHLVTNSHFSKTMIQNVMPDRDVSVVGCGITDRRWASELETQPTHTHMHKQVFRETVGLEEKPTLISVGRLVPHKNHKTAIDLVQAMKSAQLVIVGEGPYRAELEAYVAELGLADRVIFTGSVSEELKWRYLRASDVGLLLSDFHHETGGYEGFGIVMLEYAAAACVPYTTGQFGMADFSERYGAGLIGLNEDLPIETYANRLDAFLNDPDQVNSTLKKARDLIKIKYTWAKVAKSLSDVWA